MNYRSHSLRSLLLVSLRPRRSSLSRFAVLLAAIGLVLGAQAQTAHFVGYETQITTGFTLYAVNGNGGDAPAGVAVDPSGNLFVADPNGYQVLKYTASAGGYLAPTVLASGFEVEYIAAGNDGTIYCAGQNGNAVAYVPNGNGYTPAAIQVVGTSGGPVSVGGIAVDGSRNVYLADRTDGEIIKYVYAGSNRYGSQVIVGSGLHNLAGLAVYGTVVFATNGTVVLAFAPQNGGYTAPATIASGFSALSDLTATSNGTLYVADNGLIYKLTPSISGSYTKSYFANPQDAFYGGALYVTTDNGGNVFTSVNNDVNVEKIAPALPSFGQLQAGGGASAALTAAFIFDTAGPANAVISTQGITNLDFKAAGQYSATYTAATEVDIPITFQPMVPGGRKGAAEIVNSSGVVLATAYLQGIGVGPQAALYPGLQSTLLSGTTFHPQAMAVDAAGNVYVCDPTNSTVVKETLQYGTYVKTSIGSSLSSPSGIALDGAGNLYISDTGNGRVLKETFQGGTTYVQSTVVTAATPLGLAVDGNGILYVADGSAGVSKETPTVSGYVKTALSTGASAPNGVAVDSSGNLYISDLDNKRILLEVPNSSGTAYSESTVLSGFTPSGVSVDGGGDIYIPNYDNGGIVMAMPGYGNYTPNYVVTGLSVPGGIAVDQTGNLYIADSGNQRVLKVVVGGGNGLIFPDTAIGASSAPQTVTFANISSSNLEVGVPASGYNPSLSSSFTLDSSTTCSQIYPGFPYAFTLLANTNCTYAIDFSPIAAGVAYGSLIISDNSGNAPGNQQSVFVGGNGVAPTKTITFPQPGSPATLNSNATLTATASNGDPVTYAITSGTASLSGSTITYSALGSVTITASSAATSTYAAATPVSVTVQVVSAQQSMSWLPSTLSIYTGAALGTGVLDATSSISGTISYSSKLQPVGSTQAATASTVLSKGTYLLTATVTPSTSGYTVISSSLPFYVQNMNPFIANTNGSMSSVYNNGTAQSSSTTGGGIGAAVDSSGYVWSLSSNGTSAVKYNDAGGVSATYSNIGLNAAKALAVDGLGQVWIANGNNTVTVLSNAGAVVSTTTNANLSAPSGVAIDMSGNVWVTSSANNTVEEVIGGAAPVAPLANAVQNLSPATRP